MLLFRGHEYSWPNGPDPMGQHGHDPKKHDTSTTRARHHSASAGTRHGLYSAWAAGPARGTSTGTARLMGRHDAGPITLTEMAQFANLGIKSNHFSFPQATAPIAILQPPPPLVTLVPPLPQPPDASIIFSAPLSLALSHHAAGQPPRLPLAPRRRPAAVPPSRAAPGRLRRPLSSPPRPAATAAAPTQAAAAAGLACWRAQRHGTARAAPSPGRAWAGMAARRHCAARHGGAAVPRRARAGHARAVPMPCGPVGHL